MAHFLLIHLIHFVVFLIRCSDYERPRGIFVKNGIHHPAKPVLINMLDNLAENHYILAPQRFIVIEQRSRHRLRYRNTSPSFQLGEAVQRPQLCCGGRLHRLDLTNPRHTAEPRRELPFPGAEIHDAAP
ncbi:hypothetical protein D3C75_634010 [compost metagenome]